MLIFFIISGPEGQKTGFIQAIKFVYNSRTFHGHLKESRLIFIEKILIYTLKFSLRNC